MAFSIEYKLMEQRRTRRFSLHLPLAITRSGVERVKMAGQTRNISSSGVLFTAGSGAELGSPIEYVITLDPNGPNEVNLRCMGKVLRTERVESDSPGYQFAATLERYEFVRER